MAFFSRFFPTTYRKNCICRAFKVPYHCACLDVRVCDVLQSRVRAVLGTSCVSENRISMKLRKLSRKTQTTGEILIVDDHEVVRRGLRSLLSSRPEWIICGEAVDGLDAVEKAKNLRPAVVLMDISMPRMN